MRVRYMGTWVSGSPSFADAVPRYAFLPKLGTQGAGTVGLRFPKTCTPSETAELRFRIRTWRLEGDWETPFVDPTEPGSTGDFTVDITSTATTEYELLSLDLTDTPPYTVSSASGNYVLDDPVTPATSSGTFTPTAGFRVISPSDASASGISEDTDAEPDYYYNPGTGLFLPKVKFSIGSGDAPVGVRWGQAMNAPFVSSPTAEVYDFTADFMGTTVDIKVSQRKLTPSAGAPTSFNLTVTPVEWWEYRDANGNNPIWDSTDGSELSDHKTQET